MSYITEHRQKFDDLNSKINNPESLRRNSNGGNTILFSYPPDEEFLYIDEAKKLYSEKGIFIDISKLMVKFIEEEGWDSFSEFYQSMESSPHKVFYDEDAEETDLFDLIIAEIEKASSAGKIPFLIRTGSLYGTGIENVTIMENRVVMKLRNPVVIFYPSTIREDNLYFLNFKPASKYRCTLVK